MHAPDELTFGVEEEYLLLDRETGRPADRAAEIIRELPIPGDRADREFFSSQLETATAVCTRADEAEASLTEFRRAASRIAAAHGAVLAGTGLPPLGGDVAGTVTPKSRYREIQATVRTAAAHQYGTGTHVHVAVPSRDAGVDVLARLARWSPALLALTANSPLWCGEPTGFASWRHINALQWPVTGYPPPFESGADYTRTISELVASDILIDPGLVTWVARLSERYPTVELRIADAQLAAADAVDFALLARALVSAALREHEAGIRAPRLTPTTVDGAIWLAARDGLEGRLVDPLLGVAQPAFDLVDRMRESVTADLDAAGDLGRVTAYLERRRRLGSPARVQEARFADAGIAGLLDLYAAGSGRGAGAAEDPGPPDPSERSGPSRG
ncbi:YbdK family carboxylate-amine ligase [Leucobacter rhizosphaerae]|uniref:Putative glutamate--cysteine ligase 2 n=1 Tax=Leucobacter rhizosphaerae TaxID=2932245 RepID=A0ABY4FV55_9MICO|nr:YbdK family carboxylate-amine ligase [Leucobacter rhizosphaerae]UOQ60163.1 YbdK family carboxylate-amine ligase [Leucobacter rhizosphaerae]